jgi:cysteine desulfurase/selenocysteine lyase
MTTLTPTSNPGPGLADEGWLDRLAAEALSAFGTGANAPSLTVPSAPGGIAPSFGPASPYELAPGSFVPAEPGGESIGLSAVLPALLTPQTYGLPEEHDLQPLLAGVGVKSPLPLGGAPVKEPSLFYFLDPHATAPDERALGTILGEAHPGFDIRAVRRDFPILAERVHGRPLIWFDNAATTQKPNAVIERLSEFYRHENSNIHRAAHELAARATEAYEDARRTVARFLGASSADEIVFVRGTTEAINLIAKAWGPRHVGPGDEIVVSLLEHHANIVPWQQLASQVGARLRVIPVDSSGQIRLDEYQKLLNDRTKLVAISQVSNALGTITPVPELIELAHRVGARVLVDGAQSVAHLAVDVRALDADFFVFSGHKIFAPTGIGALYGKPEILAAMEPWQGGGNMIADVTFERTLYQGPPARFEAGTPNIADAVGLAEALRYVERLGLANIARYEHDLLGYGTQLLQAVPGLHLIGTAREKASVLSFVLDGYSPTEVGEELNREGIAVRAGHHCAQPIVRHFGHEATVRPSLAFYNTVDELDTLAIVLQRLAKGRRTIVTPGSEQVQAVPERRLFGDWTVPVATRPDGDWSDGGLSGHEKILVGRVSAG